MTTARALAGVAAAVVAAIVVAGGSSIASVHKREAMPHVGILTPAPSAAARPL